MTVRRIDLIKGRAAFTNPDLLPTEQEDAVKRLGWRPSRGERVRYARELHSGWGIGFGTVLEGLNNNGRVYLSGTAGHVWVAFDRIWPVMR